jgi:hypothetical protein
MGSAALAVVDPDLLAHGGRDRNDRRLDIHPRHLSGDSPPSILVLGLGDLDRARRALLLVALWSSRSPKQSLAAAADWSRELRMNESQEGRRHGIGFWLLIALALVVALILLTTFLAQRTISPGLVEALSF